MKTEIKHGPSFTLLIADLQPGEAIRAEPGAMVAQSGVTIKTGTTSTGLIGGIRRIISGESFLVNTFTASPSGGWIALAPPAPGDIARLDLEPQQGLIIQSGSFLASSPTVDTDAQFQGLKSLFSGEGFFFIRAYTQDQPGTVFYNSYGAIHEIQVTPDREIVVDSGHLVAFSEHLEYNVSKIGNIRSSILSGEGIVMKFTGSGTIWIQTRNLESLADKIAPFLPNATRK